MYNTIKALIKNLQSQKTSYVYFCYSYRSQLKIKNQHSWKYLKLFPINSIILIIG